ncbi:hypothetical protein D3C81_1399310 [compost metagenome]
MHARLSSTVVTVARALSPIFVALTLPPRFSAPLLVCLLTSTHSVLTMVPCVKCDWLTAPVAARLAPGKPVTAYDQVSLYWLCAVV